MSSRVVQGVLSSHFSSGFQEVCAPPPSAIPAQLIGIGANTYTATQPQSTASSSPETEPGPHPALGGRPLPGAGEVIWRRVSGAHSEMFRKLDVP